MMDAFTGRDPTRPVAPAFTKLSDIAAKRKGGLVNDPAMVQKLMKGNGNGRAAY